MAFRCIIFFVAVALPLAWANSAGAPNDACKDLVPQHHVDPQSSTPPYSYVLPKKRTVSPGESVAVTVRGNSDNDTIKGFLVQARPVGKSQSVGSFAPLPGHPLQGLNCGSADNALTHTKIENSVKEVSFKYTVPQNAQKGQKFNFLSTVALNGGVFWVRVPSEVFTVA
ncbi:putative defense protein Hdd11 [Phlebotomus argentipes]|uniref:putative defense protein Hdd11 n=1 Tax=Phlebotomus argentipes TaxID=94469 RepID=UPI002893299B|nr:putative defense protein Hdd11 [Phlebotomus argentipes]